MTHRIISLLHSLPTELIIISIFLMLLALLRHRNPIALMISLAKTAAIIMLLYGLYFIRPDVYQAAHRRAGSIIKIAKCRVNGVADAVERKVRNSDGAGNIR